MTAPLFGSSTAAVSFRGVGKRFSGSRGTVQALDGVSFDIAPGEFFGLLGPNGAGKTTLINILAGLAQASAGRILVHGHDVVADYAAARRSLGIVPQELVFDPFFTVRETLQIQSGYFEVRTDRRANDAWIDELLHHLGLTDKAGANMRQLSGGMKRRVLVAQALVHRPPVIVLDEPTAGVDVELRQTLWQFIAKLNKQGHTVLLTLDAQGAHGDHAGLLLLLDVALNRVDGRAVPEPDDDLAGASAEFLQAFEAAHGEGGQRARGDGRAQRHGERGRHPGKENALRQRERGERGFQIGRAGTLRQFHPHAHEERPRLGIVELLRIEDIAAVVGQDLGNAGNEARPVRA